MNQLPHSFFQRPTLDVSRDLLGKILKIGQCTGRINEVEAYLGLDKEWRFLLQITIFAWIAVGDLRLG